MSADSRDSVPAADAAAWRAEVDELRRRLAEAEETLQAIRSGDVDAVVVGERLYMLEGVESDSNRFRGEVIAQIDDAVIAVDNEQRVIYFNGAAERQYGTTASQALGRPITAIFERRWLRADDEQRVAEALQSNGRWRGRNVHIKRSGEEIHVESTVTVLRDAAGAKSGLLAVVRDVSDQVRAEREYAVQRLASEQALRDADQRKDEFLATLAHELRNPLAPIRNALQIMQLSGDAATHENARNIIGRQLQQMVHLVDDLLDVGRISQGKIELRREHVDVSSAVQAAIETSRPLIDAGRHELRLQVPPPGTLIVDADLTRLCQIIANLLNNAAKYTPPGGRIDVRAERQGPHAVISVQDSGIGIPADMLPRVFDLFTQVSRSPERSQGGLGIGLALVKRLVEMHGGTVCAHSEGAGQGCRFVVELPCVAGLGMAPASIGPATHAESDQGACVLVADDNVDSAESLSEALRLMGYRTVTANDGFAAVRMARLHRPYAAVLDIGMPGMDGLEAAQQIRSQQGGGEVLLLALSGWGQEGDRSKSMAAGFDHHLVKPVDIDALTRLLAPHGERKSLASVRPA